MFAQLIYSESTFFAAKQIVCNSYLNVTPSQENCPKKIWSDGVLKMISGLLEDLSKLTPVWLSWCLRISLLSLYNNLKANMRERLWGALQKKTENYRNITANGGNFLLINRRQSQYQAKFCWKIDEKWSRICSCNQLQVIFDPDVSPCRSAIGFDLDNKRSY